MRGQRIALLATVAGGLAGIGALGIAIALIVQGSAASSSAASAAEDQLSAPRAGSADAAVEGGSDAGPEAQKAASSRLVQLVDAAWTEEVAENTGIPERALAAYAGAAIEANERFPECGIGWNTLAGIGEVETQHGSMHGAKLAADGTVSPTIIGIALDGSSTDAVADTDDGEIDGDENWDRAVGPMQFIPSTWRLVAEDRNGDGKTDVNQIDDAALSAAVHLCEVGGDLTSAEGWIAAVGAYNSSVDYNNRVAEAADHYAVVAER